MGIYICGMEMPTEEEKGKCIIVRHDGEVLSVEFDNLVDGGYVACYPTNPTRAFPVPPHGRLIDADKLDDVCVRLNSEDWGITVGEHKLLDSVLFEFPTVLPEEKLEKE